MKTWTQRIKDWEKNIFKGTITIWGIRYLPKYRYIALHGDGLLQFRGSIATDGQSIYITAVNTGDAYMCSKRIFVEVDGVECGLQPHMILDLKQFEDVLRQYVFKYS